MPLIDSSYIIALINTKDKNNKRAITLYNEIEKHDEKIIPLLMLSEAITSISSRMGGTVSNKLYKTLIKEFEIYYPTKLDVENAMDCVLKYDGTLSLADSLAIYIMKKNKINNIYSFDSDFDKVKGIIRIH
ncbi:type II toxin-antitoxin system VapC family toxin [Methanobrevibacter sp. DSM 116169]|uniref:type II toxin-antitoxin system VapC family toxin n=1 Tax=Methanobrevibacter sp. DSM 116169 TaxID=3242727 RepID=UPI0038FD0B6D